MLDWSERGAIFVTEESQILHSSRPAHPQQLQQFFKYPEIGRNLLKRCAKLVPTIRLWQVAMCCLCIFHIALVPACWSGGNNRWMADFWLQWRHHGTESTGVLTGSIKPLRGWEEWNDCKLVLLVMLMFLIIHLHLLKLAAIHIYGLHCLDMTNK